MAWFMGTSSSGTSSSDSSSDSGDDSDADKEEEAGQEDEDVIYLLSDEDSDIEIIEIGSSDLEDERDEEDGVLEMHTGPRTGQQVRGCLGGGSGVLCCTCLGLSGCCPGPPWLVEA